MPSRAHTAFKELASWLGVSEHELSDILGISRAVSRENATEPHNKAEARRLYELHSVVSALQRALGSDLAGWLRRGSPSPLELLKQQEHEGFERRADEVIFPTTREPRRRLDTASEPRGSEPAAPKGTLHLKPAGRARSRRLPR